VVGLHGDMVVVRPESDLRVESFLVENPFDVRGHGAIARRPGISAPEDLQVLSENADVLASQAPFVGAGTADVGEPALIEAVQDSGSDTYALFDA